MAGINWLFQCELEDSFLPISVRCISSFLLDIRKVQLLGSISSREILSPDWKSLSMALDFSEPGPVADSVHNVLFITFCSFTLRVDQAIKCDQFLREVGSTHYQTKYARFM